jgi:hypothetical protein
MTIEIEPILADLVAIPSLPGTPNTAIVDRVRAELARHGVESAVITGGCQIISFSHARGRIGWASMHLPEK